MRDLRHDRTKNRRDALALLRRQPFEVALATRHLTGHDFVEVLTQFTHDRRRPTCALVIQILLHVISDDSLRVVNRLSSVAQRLTDPIAEVTDIDATDVVEPRDVARDRAG